MQFDDFFNAIPTMHYFNYRNNTPEWQIVLSRIDFIDITYVLGGQAVYTINEQEHHVTVGDLLCIPRGSTRWACSEDPAGFSCFCANFCMKINSKSNVDVPLPLISSIGMHEDLIAQYKKLNEEWLKRGPGYVMQVRARLMMILQRLMEMLVYEVDTFQFDSRVKAAIRYLTDHYAKPLHISEVAEFVSLNPVYFGALFKKETQVAFRDYLNMVRLNQAEDMLRTGKLNVSEVAARCGFLDVFYFSRLFKKHKGIPPSSVQP